MYLERSGSVKQTADLGEPGEKRHTALAAPEPQGVIAELWPND